MVFGIYRLAKLSVCVVGILFHFPFILSLNPFNDREQQSKSPEPGPENYLWMRKIFNQENDEAHVGTILSKHESSSEL